MIEAIKDTPHPVPQPETAQSAVSGSESSQQFVALLYHELRSEPSDYSYVLPCERFDEHLRWFATLQQQPGRFHPLLTFDDGHLSNYEHALPALQQHQTTAYFFITAGWTGRRSGYMRPEHLRALQVAGQRIGAHGWSHALLTQCSPAELKRELTDARAALEDWVSTPVTSMSLPGGRSNDRVMAACREAGYTTVWTSAPGAHALPLPATVGRFNMHASTSIDFLKGLMDPSSGVLAGVRRKQRAKQMLQHVLGDRLYGRLWAVLNREEPGGPQAVDGAEPAA